MQYFILENSTSKVSHGSEKNFYSNSQSIGKLCKVPDTNFVTILMAEKKKQFVKVVGNICKVLYCAPQRDVPWKEKVWLPRVWNGYIFYHHNNIKHKTSLVLF